jgi:cell wall-associated NlpC family hydrolase
MLTAGYWISNAPSPDKLIMDNTEIAQFNSTTMEKYRFVSISDYGEYKSSTEIKAYILAIFKDIESQTFYGNGDRKISKSEVTDFKETFRLDELSGDMKAVTHAVVVNHTDLRVAPTNEHFYRGRNMRLDSLQITSLLVGTPVVVLWTNHDSSWYFVQSAVVSGWTPAENIAYCTPYEIKQWESPTAFTVITRYRAAIYDDEYLHAYKSWGSLGARLPLDTAIQKPTNAIPVQIPHRNKHGWLYVSTGYIAKSDANIGYLPYTTRNALNTAFEMLNDPYGWGGLDSKQDCSGFISKIFDTFGILLPRNSHPQGTAGEPLYSAGADVKRVLAESGIAGGTLVQFPGHIMLYIGTINSEPYAIHNLLSFYADGGEDKDLRFPARVAVSDLNLSTKSKNGAYYQRVANISNIIIKR